MCSDVGVGGATVQRVQRVVLALARAVVVLGVEPRASCTPGAPLLSWPGSPRRDRTFLPHSNSTVSAVLFLRVGGCAGYPQVVDSPFSSYLLCAPIYSWGPWKRLHVLGM